MGRDIHEIMPKIVRNPEDVLRAYHIAKRTGAPYPHYYTLIDGSPGEASWYVWRHRMYHVGWTYPAATVPESIDIFIDGIVVHSYVPPGCENTYMRPSDIVGLPIDESSLNTSDPDYVLEKHDRAVKEQKHSHLHYTIDGIERWSVMIPNGNKVYHISRACPQI